MLIPEIKVRHQDIMDNDPKKWSPEICIIHACHFNTKLWKRVFIYYIPARNLFSPEVPVNLRDCPSFPQEVTCYYRDGRVKADLKVKYEWLITCIILFAILVSLPLGLMVFGIVHCIMQECLFYCGSCCSFTTKCTFCSKDNYEGIPSEDVSENISEESEIWEHITDPI
jgi:hypothetical protein